MSGDGSSAAGAAADPAGPADQPSKAIFKSYKHGARRILVAAERLFGEHGINGVSLRQILAAAGQGNKSAVHHHFGSKEGLIRATFDMRMPALEKISRFRLREAERQGQLGIRELLEVLLLPFVELSPASARRACAQFHSQLDTLYEASPEHPRERWRGHASATEEVHSRLRCELAWLPEDIFDARMALVSQLVLPGIARIDHNDISRFKQADGSLERDLMNMATAAVSAPWP